MGSNSARLAEELRDLANQLRFLESALTSSRTRLTGDNACWMASWLY
jgi:hypothetical protein